MARKTTNTSKTSKKSDPKPSKARIRTGVNAGWISPIGLPKIRSHGRRPRS